MSARSGVLDAYVSSIDAPDGGVIPLYARALSLSTSIM